MARRKYVLKLGEKTATLTEKQLELLDVAHGSHAIASGEAAFLMMTTTSAIGRLMSGLTKHNLAYFEVNWDGVNGPWQLWLTDEGYQAIKDNPEALRTMRTNTGVPEECL